MCIRETNVPMWLEQSEGQRMVGSEAMEVARVRSCRAFYAMLRTLNFILKMKGSYWKILSKRMT